MGMGRVKIGRGDLEGGSSAHSLVVLFHGQVLLHLAYGVLAFGIDSISIINFLCS
jgi:hypothetical protein